MQNRGVAEQIVFDYLCQQEYWATAEAAGPTLTCSATPISPKDLEASSDPTAESSTGVSPIAFSPHNFCKLVGLISAFAALPVARAPHLRCFARPIEWTPHHT